MRTKVTLTSGASLEGLVLNRGLADLQMLGDDRQIHLLRKTGERYRAVTSQTDWPSYNGETSGNRYSHARRRSKEQRRAGWRRNGFSACRTRRRCR